MLIPASYPMVRFALIAFAVMIGLGGAPALARQTCKDFSTCEEAMKAYKTGNTRLDGDKDGIPCENLCRTR
jgi:hypothetical protein